LGTTLALVPNELDVPPIESAPLEYRARPQAAVGPLVVACDTRRPALSSL